MSDDVRLHSTMNQWITMIKCEYYYNNNIINNILLLYNILYYYICGIETLLSRMLYGTYTYASVGRCEEVGRGAAHWGRRRGRREAAGGRRRERLGGEWYHTPWWCLWALLFMLYGVRYNAAFGSLLCSTASVLDYWIVETRRPESPIRYTIVDHFVTADQWWAGWIGVGRLSGHSVAGTVHVRRKNSMTYGVVTRSDLPPLRTSTRFRSSNRNKKKTNQRQSLNY